MFWFHMLESDSVIWNAGINASINTFYDARLKKQFNNIIRFNGIENVDLSIWELATQNLIFSIEAGYKIIL